MWSSKKSSAQNGEVFGRQMSKLELIQQEVSRDEEARSGPWRPFQDIRYGECVCGGVYAGMCVCVCVYVCVGV